jgi:molybdopterin-guanine dinucleotide biosynthesis protein A
MPQLIGVVLAGGEGSRLGRPKGEIVIDGISLVDRAARALRPLCGSVLISVGVEGTGFATGYDVVVDADPAGRGPLAGIAAAFESTGKADLVVLACDYPRVETPLLQTLVSSGRPEDDLVIVSDLQGRDHPLVGLWRRSTEAHVKAALADRIHKVRALLSQFEVRRLGPDELPQFDLDEVLLNLNTPEDLERVPDTTP